METKRRSRQETFDIVVNHLLTQGKKSEGPDGRCLYRGPNGLKCAAGVLIPDEKYVPAMDCLRQNKKAILANEGIVGEVIREEGHDPDFVKSLQATHDAYDVERWEDDLRLTADVHGLEFKGRLSSI